jgi:hypothetical protein
MKIKNYIFFLTYPFSLVPSAVHCQNDSTQENSLFGTEIRFDAFVDTYYMYDFNSPGYNEKSHPFTQPLRHNEFNINLAHLELRLDGKNIRGALAIHTGTSVKANYAGEINNRELSQFIHEAWAGYRIAKDLWVDAGIYSAPYGFESWLSRDNKTYSRSFVADFSPYYQTGVKLSWQASSSLSAAIHVINGWQNIAETNNSKAIGISLGYVPSSVLSFTYNNFIGNEQPDSIEGTTRFYNDLCTRFTASEHLEFDLTTDYGTQPKDGSTRDWVGIALIGRYRFAETPYSVTLRGEYYKDKYQIIFSTGTPNGFDGFGLSVNFDVALSSKFLWRTEGRMLDAKFPVFPSKEGSITKTGFLVTSFGLSI